MQSFTTFVLLIFISYVRSDCYAPASINSPYVIPKPKPRNLDYCQWYNSLTCCTSDPNLSNKYKFDGKVDGPCGNPPSGECSHYLNLFYCRYCSPLYTSYLNSTGGLFRICKKFANELYDACSSFQIQTTNADCQQVGTYWKNGKDFIENIFFGNLYVEDNTLCFNSSTQILPSILIWSTVVLGLMIFINLFQ